MQKPLSRAGQGFVLESFTTILHQTSTKKQITLLINRESLTDALDLLEKQGYTGDTAIFILANLQHLEAVR